MLEISIKVLLSVMSFSENELSISCADFRNKCILMSSKIIIKINPLMKSHNHNIMCSLLYFKSFFLKIQTPAPVVRTIIAKEYIGNRVKLTGCIVEH